MNLEVGDNFNLDEECHPKKCKRFNAEFATCYRNFHCMKYDKCLNYAIKCDWNSFSCKECKNFLINNDMDQYEKLEFYIIRNLIKSTESLVQKFKN